jgi:CRISPR/Cas system-associated endoribonuclease Cas2
LCRSESRSRALAAFLGAERARVQVSVYNVNAKKWIAPSESVETIEQGKLKAATYAETYLRQVANLELPPLQWKESRAA